MEQVATAAGVWASPHGAGENCRSRCPPTAQGRRTASSSNPRGAYELIRLGGLHLIKVRSTRALTPPRAPAKRAPTDLGTLLARRGVSRRQRQGLEPPPSSPPSPPHSGPRRLPVVRPNLLRSIRCLRCRRRRRHHCRRHRCRRRCCCPAPTAPPTAATADPDATFAATVSTPASIVTASATAVSAVTTVATIAAAAAATFRQGRRRHPASRVMASTRPARRDGR